MKPKLDDLQQLALDQRLTGYPMPILLGYLDEHRTRVELEVFEGDPVLRLEHFEGGELRGEVTRVDLDRDDRDLFHFIVRNGLDDLEDYLVGLAESREAYAQLDSDHYDRDLPGDSITYNDAGEPIGYC